jgi:hypothetical protein
MRVLFILSALIATGMSIAGGLVTRPIIDKNTDTPMADTQTELRPGVYYKTVQSLGLEKGMDYVRVLNSHIELNCEGDNPKWTKGKSLAIIKYDGQNLSCHFTRQAPSSPSIFSTLIPPVKYKPNKPSIESYPGQYAEHTVKLARAIVTEAGDYSSTLVSEDGKEYLIDRLPPGKYQDVVISNRRLVSYSHVPETQSMSCDELKSRYGSNTYSLPRDVFDLSDCFKDLNTP